MNEARSRDLVPTGKRRELLQALLRQQGEHAETGIPRRTGAGPVPLSFAQERLWFLDQYYPGSPAYDIPAPFPLYGPLDPRAVEAAVNEIVRRHEALRTTFAVRDGQPVQVVAPSLEIPLAVVDTTHLPESERQGEAMRILADERRHIFDLTRGPLLRATLVRLLPHFHYLILNMHHIVSDGWSLAIFGRELEAARVAFTQGRRPELPELPIQYPDFAVWQRGWAQGPEFAGQLAYWKKQLGDLDLAPLELPADRPRPLHSSFSGATIAFGLPDALAEKLRAAGQQANATPFMVLAAGLAALLYRYTGRESLAIGFPVANRNRSEIEGLIGLFVNSLPLHVRMAGDLTFRTLLARVREAMLGALAHQDLPFERLVEELQPARSLSTNPLFQVLFDLRTVPAGQAGASGGDGTFESPVMDDTAKLDLSLQMAHDGTHLSGSVQYSTDLFDEATMRRFIGHYRTVLAALADAPDAPLARLPLMPQYERERVLGGFNSTAMPFPGGLVHELFERQADRTPDAPALVWDGGSLTYRALDGRANQLAALLRERGTGCEDVVAICMDGSPETILALLGILKAGAAYLPLDPAYPSDRIAFMLADARARIALTQTALLPLIAPLVETALALDADLPELDARSDARLAPIACPDDVAYVMYTSGSTGRPKGVVVPHAGVVNTIACFAAIYENGLGPGAHVLQFSSLGFDTSVREIFEALSTGAALHVAPREDMLAGEPLVRLMRARGITMATLAPSVWASLPAAELPALRIAASGGESCIPSTIERWAPGRAFYNGYGPTETSICNSTHRCTPGVRPSIGGPGANVRYYVVDANLEPCPVGVPGELLIGGIAVARGYLGRPGLTAEQFVPDPFGSEPGARLYRTGDLARWLPSGEIDHLGRIDGQIKIHGVRIEPAEIEVVLSEDEAVAASSVTVSLDANGEKRLVAYVVPADKDRPPSADELRARLAAKLPGVMVPQHFILLPEIPLTTAGKLDLRGLPTPEEAAVEHAYVAPRTRLETLLAEIWSEVLHRERIGVDDNFFELGGHSLIVTQVVSRVRDSLGIEMKIRTIFEHPTIAELACHLRAAEPAATREMVES
jgi:amino acid adenylation domain-containing protein